MVIETLWPDNAPWWLNLFIWMATFWWYILVGFVPAFYVAVVKLFGMPLLQRWTSEVVIMVYPNKLKFGKITNQMEPYIKYDQGVYWLDTALEPEIHQEVDPKIEEKLISLKKRYDELASPDNKTLNKEKLMKRILTQQRVLQKRIITVDPRNHIRIFSHAINQQLDKMERREAKAAELLYSNPNPKRIAPHGIWLLQNPKLHFHRHYQLVINPEGTLYKLIPVKDRQQFGIGFWHSLGIVMQRLVEVEVEKEIEEGSSVSGGKQLKQIVVTTQLVAQQMKLVQDYPNYSASRCFMFLKRRAKIESPYGFNSWIQGSFDTRILLLLAGMVGAVAMIFLLFHGNSPTTAPTPPPGGLKIL